MHHINKMTTHSLYRTIGKSPKSIPARISNRVKRADRQVHQKFFPVNIIEVEVKTGTKLRPQQRKWKKFIESFGGIYVLCSYNKKLSAEENVLVAIQTIDQAVAERREQ